MYSHSLLCTDDTLYQEIDLILRYDNYKSFYE